MSIRFTNDILSRQTLFDLGNITDKLSKTQNELSSASASTRPRTIRTAPARAVSLRNELADVQQYPGQHQRRLCLDADDGLRARQRHGPAAARARADRAGRERHAEPGLAERDLLGDDADQGIAARARRTRPTTGATSSRARHERPAVPVERLRRHDPARAAPDRARRGRAGQHRRPDGLRHAGGRPAGRRRTSST